MQPSLCLASGVFPDWAFRESGSKSSEEDEEDSRPVGDSARHIRGTRRLVVDGFDLP